MEPVLIMDNLIEKSFIRPDLNIIGFSSYAVRTSLITAINQVKPNIKGIVVDLGCGEMPYREYLTKEGKIKKYVGIDIQPTEYHNKIQPDLYWDGQTIPLPDNYADWVIATEFLEHYFDTQHILKEIYRVLKPDGCIFFTVPFLWPLHEIPYDAYRFTPFSLEKHFELAKFRNITVKSLGGLNRSLAIVVGVWIEHLKNRYIRKIIKLSWIMLYKWLLKKDKAQMSYSNHQFYSGFWGIAEK
jgi:SAM-dependent methyltransferase